MAAPALLFFPRFIPDILPPQDKGSSPFSRRSIDSGRKARGLITNTLLLFTPTRPGPPPPLTPLLLLTANKERPGRHLHPYKPPTSRPTRRQRWTEAPRRRQHHPSSCPSSPAPGPSDDRRKHPCNQPCKAPFCRRRRFPSTHRTLHSSWPDNRGDNLPTPCAAAQVPTRPPLLPRAEPPAAG